MSTPTYAEVLQLQDQAERAELTAHLGGRFAWEYRAALRRVVIARTRFERSRPTPSSPVSVTPGGGAARPDSANEPGRASNVP